MPLTTDLSTVTDSTFSISGRENIVFNNKEKRDEEIKLITKTINASKLFFKKQLSKNSNLRSVPNLRFIYDETESKAYELEQLINKNLYK